ncbi:uncharacterized protein LOC117807790 [Notolabrus celidotus]|uniref:uncharacterized protein LOC117807790 n=1 Tax=Notolabrus celidotus TaxID=1203425 RepID=UPI0014907221|nr:uncharacterized protein LOC117807790 [Notolabrus celidotus]
MAHTLLCAVVFLMLNTLLHCGRAEDNPRPVLTVSPSWLRPGDSVTLNCSVNDPDKGWLFYWYKAVPRRSNNYNQMNLCSSSSGTERNSYIVNGQTHTAAYVCGVKRDNAQNLTWFSKPKFVLSRDSQSTSVKVSPDRVQHNTSDSVTVICEGKSDEWRVMRLTEAGHLSNCSSWGSMKGSTCSINKHTKKTAVYWCESGLGQFSNAVNITFQKVSQSENSSFLLPLLSGLFGGLLTIILLLGLCFYIKSKKTKVARIKKTQRTNQGSAEDEVINHSGTPTDVQSSYPNDADELNEVTYSMIEFKNIRSKGKSFPAESDDTVYSQVKPGTLTGKLDVRMGLTSHWILGFFWTVSSIKYGHGEAAQQVNVTLRADSTTIPVGGQVALTCSVDYFSSGWRYKWFRRENGSSVEIPVRNRRLSFNPTISVTKGGDYWCKADRMLSSAFTEDSDFVTIHQLVSNRAVVTLEPNGTQIFSGETKTLRCEIQGGDGIEWEYEWTTSTSNIPPRSNEYKIGKVGASNDGDYYCKGRHKGDVHSSTQWSEAVTLTFFPNKAVATIQPKWTKIYKGELIIFTCEIEDEGNTDWVYELKTSSSYIPQIQLQILTTAGPLHTGDYSCVGIKASDRLTMTAWSESIPLRVYDYIPKPTLAVSPSWLSPGDSVTLSCEVEHPSAGWRFFWYKAVPKLSDKSYSYELLPGSSNGSALHFHVVHGQTHTAGYVCRAGRGDEIYFTRYSDPKFVWSGDTHSASLTVSSDRVQHFTTDSVTLSCKGSSDTWRVKAANDKNFWSDNSDCGTMTGATCQVSGVQEAHTVYWCESGSGEFSNAVNISADKKNMILISPVHPVTEGDSFTLGCKLKNGTFNCTVFFFLNDEIIGSGTAGTLKISAASKSDEGLYKCKCGKKQSPQSWVAIKSTPESLSLVPVLTGLFFGVGVIVLVLLLCYCKKVKDPHSHGMLQSLNANRGSATDQITNQDEYQHVYSSLAHGDFSIYESIDPNRTGNGETVYENTAVTLPPTELNHLQIYSKLDVSTDVSGDYVNQNSATGL